jgi:hypothetical protein
MLRHARLGFLTAKLASSLGPIRLTQRNKDIRAPPNRVGARFVFRDAKGSTRLPLAEQAFDIAKPLFARPNSNTMKAQGYLVTNR